MILENPKAPRAERFVAIIDAALLAWAARWWLYVGMALAAIAILYPVEVVAHYDIVTMAIASGILDSLMMAVVSIDVVERMRDEPRPLRSVVASALRRWPVVAIVSCVVITIQEALYP